VRVVELTATGGRKSDERNVPTIKAEGGVFAKTWTRSYFDKGKKFYE